MSQGDNWKKPNLSELTPYQLSYVKLVPEGDLISILENNSKNTLGLLASLSSEKLKFRYAEGKWSIPQVLVHVIDTERIFSYRILCIGRGDKTPLPGFEQDDYAKASDADKRQFSDILEEYIHVRKATLSLLRGFSAKQLSNTGISDNKVISVRTLCYLLAGHEIHHMNVLKEKYLT